MSGENVLLLLRLGFSLALVFGLMWVAARVVRGRGAAMRTKVDHLEVLERKALTRNSSIAIVRIGGETVAVGITDTQVSLIGPAHVDASDASDPAAADATTVPVTEDVVTPVAHITTPAAARTSAAPAVPVPAGGRRSFLDALRDRTVRHIPG